MRDTHVVLSQMSSLNQLSCKHNTNNNPDENVEIKFQLFEVQLEHLNLELQSKDVVIETNNIQTFLEIKYDTHHPLGKHFNCIMDKNRINKTPVIITLLHHEFVNIMEIFQRTETNFGTFMKTCFPLVHDQKQDIPRPGPWLREICQELNRLYDTNVSALMKHFSIVRVSNTLIREKFEILKSQFPNHDQKQLSNTTLIQELTNMKETIDLFFDNQQEQRIQFNNSLKQEITDIVLSSCTTLYDCYHTCSRLLKYLDTTYVKALKSSIEKVEAELNITNVRQAMDSIRKFHFNDKKRCTESLEGIKFCLELFQTVSQSPKTLCIPNQELIEEYDQSTRQLGVYILQFECLIRVWNEISDGKSNPYIVMLPSVPSLVTKE